MEEFKFKIKNITTTTLDNLKPGDKIIRTKDWGDFKIRKNGKYRLKIGNEIVRVSRYGIPQAII